MVDSAFRKESLTGLHDQQRATICQIPTPAKLIAGHSTVRTFGGIVIQNGLIIGSDDHYGMADRPACGSREAEEE